jgi:Ras family protein A
LSHILVSFLTRDQWYPEVLHFCPTTPLMLLGLKSDLRTNPRCIDMLKAQGLTPVTIEQGRAVARKMGATYMECSAREGRGVKEIFENGITIAVGDDYPGYKQIEAKAAKAEKMRNGGAGGKSVDSGILQVPTKKKKSRSCKIL